MNPQEEIHIDDILNVIRNPDGQPPSDYFRNYAHEFFQEIAGNRQAMGFKPYTRQDLVHLLSQGTYDEWIFRNDKRKDGKPYFTHPAETARLLVRDQGFTGLVSIQGGWKHDNIEDHSDKPLCADPRSYQHLLGLGIEQTKAFIADILEEQKKISGIVNGVSKFKRKLMEKMKLTADEDALYKIFQAAGMNTEDEITMYRFLKYAFENPLVVNIKGADRTHNTFDKAGIDLLKRILKDKETLGWYIPMLDLWGAYMAVEMLLRGVAMDINPDLLKRFKSEIDSREKAILDENIRAKIIDRFKDGSNGALLPYLKSVEIKPRLFSEFVYPRIFDDPFADKSTLAKKLKNLTFDGLAIHPDDNMHQIVVLTNLAPALTDSSGERDASEKFFRKITETDPTKILEAQGIITSRFCSASGIGSGHKVSYDAFGAGLNRGLLVKVFNRDFGQLLFRINDGISEARSRRGHAAHLENNYSPRILYEGLKRVMNIMKQTRSGVRAVRSVASIGREELLKPRIIVYSREGDAIEMSQGATVLDLAVKIHSDVLRNALAVICYDDTLNTKPRKVSLCEELVDGQKYEIITDPKHLKKVGVEAQTVHPREILYCNPETRKRIREFRLKKEGNCSEIGLNFLNDMSRIFQMDYSQLVELVKKGDRNLANTVDEKILEEIAKGRVNPLEIISKEFVTDNRWHVEVVLKHEGGTSDDFLEKFRSGLKFNKDNVETRTVPDDPGSRIFAMDVEFSTADVTVYEFMKRILRLHYDFGYDVNVISCRRESRVAEVGEAAEGQSGDQEIGQLQTASQRKDSAQGESSGQGANDQHKPKKRKTIFEMVLRKVLALF